MLFRSIFAQYLLETLVLLGVAAVALLPTLKTREPRKTLAVLTGLNLLRLGGMAGAVAALGQSRAPAVLIVVAIGDGLAGTLALVAFVLLLRRSSNAWFAVAAMNVVGLVGIVVSETWLTSLELRGDIVRNTFLHGPTMGAAVYTTLHILAFHILRTSTSNRRSRDHAHEHATTRPGRRADRQTSVRHDGPGLWRNSR
jgi:hypothetical protein